MLSSLRSCIATTCPLRSCLEPSVFCGDAELDLKIDILPLMSHFSTGKTCRWSMAKLNFTNSIYSGHFLTFLKCSGAGRAELKAGVGLRDVQLPSRALRSCPQHGRAVSSGRGSCRGFHQVCGTIPWVSSLTPGLGEGREASAVVEESDPLESNPLPKFPERSAQGRAKLCI